MRSATAKKSAFICLLLACAVVALYWQVRHFEFLIFDDTVYVSLNPEVHQGLTWKALAWAFTTNACTNWHPLTWISHLLDWQFFGSDAGKHHITSVLLHAASSVVLFLALKEMTGATWRCAFVAALFAMHPLRVESVAWVAERKDVLSTLFFMLTLWAYARYAMAKSPKSKVQSPKPATPPVSSAKKKMAKGEVANSSKENIQHSTPNIQRPRFYYFLTLGFFALGLMAKPMLVTLPFVLLLLDFWPLNRVSSLKVEVSSSPTSNLKPQTPNLLPLLMEKLPFFILTIAACVVTVWAQKSGGAVVSLNRLPTSFRVANVFVSYLHYLESFFWPANLAAPYPYPKTWSAVITSGAIAVLVGISIVAIFLRRKQPWLLVGWLWFLGMLVPVIGVLQVGAQPFADRYTYLPTIGLAFALAWGVSELLATWPARKFALTIASGAILLACVALTNKQIAFWQNTGTLFDHTLQVTKDNAFAHNNLAVYLLNNGKHKEAIEHAQTALKLVPDYPDPHPTLAYALGETGHTEEAAEHYVIAGKFFPNDSKLHNGYGTVLGTQGKMEQACDEFSKSVAIEPGFPEAHQNWGLTLMRMGKLDEAAQRLRESVRLRPNYSVAWRTLGNVLLNLNQLDEAEKAYLECLRQLPNDATSFLNLGTVYFRENKLAAAAEKFREGLRLEPNNYQFHLNLGLALAQTGQSNDAIAELQQALKLKPDSPEIEAEIRRLSK